MKVKIYYIEKILFIVPGYNAETKEKERQKYDTANAEANWQLVWEGTTKDLKIFKGTDQEVVESIWWIFQNEKGEIKDFEDRSISPGDVICLDERCYQCKGFGWHELQTFPLK